MKTLKKSNIRVYMYKGKFKDKDDFWNNVVEKRVARDELKKGLIKYEKDLGKRYKHIIPKENFDRIKNIIFYAIGTPSFYKTINFAGEARKSAYGGSDTEGNYSRRCTFRIVRHCFDIKASRELIIEEASFDGLYNVDCRLIKEINGIKIYKASWIQKRRGYEFDIIDGFVASNGVISFHGNSVREALEGLKRKTKRKIKAILKDESIIDVTKFRRITGACETGCNNFLAKHDIPSTIKMSIKDAIEMLRSKGQSMYADMLEKAIIK